MERTIRRLARRNIWLYADGDVWLVEARVGDNDRPVHACSFACQPDVRALLTQLIDTAAAHSSGGTSPACTGAVTADRWCDDSCDG